MRSRQQIEAEIATLQKELKIAGSETAGRVIEVLCKQLSDYNGKNGEVPHFTLASKLGDNLKMDSLDIVELVMGLEDQLRSASRKGRKRSGRRSAISSTTSKST